MVERIQAAEGFATNDPASWSATFASSPSEGSLLVAAVGFQQNSGGSRVVGLQESGWTRILSCNRAWVGNELFAKIAGESESSTVTAEVTNSTSNNNGSIVIFEFAGPFDSESVSEATHSNRAVAFSLTSRQTNSLSPEGLALVIPTLGVEGPAADVSINQDFAGLTHRRPGTGAHHRSIAMAWLEVDGGTHNPTFSWTNDAAASTSIAAFPLAEESDPYDPAELDVVITGDDAALTWSAPQMAGTDHTDVFRRGPESTVGALSTDPFDPTTDTRIARVPVATTTYDDEGLAAGFYAWQVFPVDSEE